MADYRYSFQDVKRVFQPQWMAPEGNQILSDQLYTLLKFRLNEFTYRVWWINCNMLHYLHDIVIHDGLKGYVITVIVRRVSIIFCRWLNSSFE